MQAIKCELCGGNELIKKDGFFQCEYCGTKYTLEEARKLIGKVEIAGDVSVKSADFVIRAGVLEKYNGSDVNVVIPENVLAIGKMAFSGCKYIKTIEIPSCVVEIQDSAFYDCVSLEKIDIPDGVTLIGWYAFCGCSSLKNIAIPAGITSIGIGVFAGCSSLESVAIPDGVTSIRERAFAGCSSLESVILPTGVTSIEEKAFIGCSSLKSITIPGSVVGIGEKAFYLCSSLSKVSASTRWNMDFSDTPYGHAKRRSQGVCQHCGSAFKGLINKTCSCCGKPKDY